eukprot:538268-Hanusia_phi.AAC.1
MPPAAAQSDRTDRDIPVYYQIRGRGQLQSVKPEFKSDHREPSGTGPSLSGGSPIRDAPGPAAPSLGGGLPRCGRGPPRPVPPFSRVVRSDRRDGELRLIASHHSIWHGIRSPPTPPGSALDGRAARPGHQVHRLRRPGGPPTRSNPPESEISRRMPRVLLSGPAACEDGVCWGGFPW